MKSFNIRGGKDKSDGTATPPKKGGAVPPAVKQAAPQPLGKATEEQKAGQRAPAALAGKKSPKQKAPRVKKEREPRPVVEKNAKKLSPGLIVGIVALVLIVGVLVFLMKKPAGNLPTPAAPPGLSDAQKARMEMRRKKEEEARANQAATGTDVPAPAAKKEPAQKSFLKTEKELKSRAVPVVKDAPKPKRDFPRKVKAQVVKERRVEKQPVRTVAKSPATERARPKAAEKPKVTIKPKVTMSLKNPYDLERENIVVKPLGPVEPGYLPPEPGSSVEEEFKRQTIFYMVLVEEADTREELRALASGMNLTTVSPEIREKSYGDRNVYWLTVGHYTREADAYNMAQVIRRMGYIAEVVSEKVYH